MNAVLSHSRCLFLVASLAIPATCQSLPATGLDVTVPASDMERDLEVAVHFAPVFHQALGSSPRFDYLTRFDFDRDWRGDNNWANAADPQFPLEAFVYFSVIESERHYFIHYAVFHPRDYKGGEQYGALLSEIIRAGVLLGGEYDPTGRATEAVLAHENDVEGALVVAEKSSDLTLADSRVVLVETLAHNTFLDYAPAGSQTSLPAVDLQGTRPVLFIEPMGHGIQALKNDTLQKRMSQNGVVVYRYAGKAQVPDSSGGYEVGYDLLPTLTTLWARAGDMPNATYGETHDYGVLTLPVKTPDGRAQRQFRVGVRGSALRGVVGARNMARPPWAWFDGVERDRPLGEWYLDPLKTLSRRGAESRESYTYHPFVGLFRSLEATATGRSTSSDQ